MQPHGRLRIILFSIMLLATSGIARHALGQTASSKERTVERLSRKSAPFKVKHVKTKKGEFSLGQKLVDEDDWFNGLSVVLENTSGKTIIYIRAGFLFPRQNGEVGKAPPLYKSLSYGRYPSAPEGVALNAQLLALRPGERFTVTLSEDDYREIVDTLQRLEYDRSIKSIKFNLEEVYFDDGTGWAGGTWLDHYPQDRNNNVREQQQVSNIPERLPKLLNSNLMVPNMFSNLLFIKTNLQEVCTVQSQPAQGTIGRCGVYDGFYSRRCCADCCPAQTQCYKREA